jgi:hypothetical protein
MRDLAGSVEVSVKTRDEQKIVVPRPVWLFPCVVDDFDLDVARQQARDQRTNLWLEDSAVVCTLAVIVHVNRNDADPHGCGGFLS